MLCLLTGLELYFDSNSPRVTLIPAVYQMSRKVNGMFQAHSLVKCLITQRDPHSLF